MTDNKFTVLVRTYNSKKVLLDAISSLESQTYGNFEVIFVDDGSVDGTLEFLKKQELNFNFKICSQEHKGPFFAEILGFKECDKNSYFLLLDSDDKLFPYSLERLNELINKEKPDMLFFNYRIFGAGIGEKSSANLSLRPRYKNISDFVMDCFKYHYEAPLSAWNHVVKASLFSKFTFNNSFRKIVVGEEFVAIFSYLLEVKSVAYCPEELYLYRCDNPQSVTKHRAPFEDRFWFIFIGLSMVMRQIETSKLFSSSQICFLYKIILNDYFNDMLFESRIIGFKSFKLFAKEMYRSDLFLRFYSNRKLSSKNVKSIVFMIKHRLYLFAYIRICLRCRKRDKK